MKPWLALALLLNVQAVAQTAPLSPQALNAAARYSAERRGQALLVIQDGRELFAQGQNGFPLGTPHLLASGSKSFSCGLAVAMQDAGSLRLDERVADTIQEWRSDPLKREVTVRHLLSFTSGLPGDTGARAVRLNRDLYGDTIGRALEAPPGERYTYGNSHLAAFGELVKRKTGLNPADAMNRLLFGPLGMTVTWTTDQQGNPNLAGSASTTARDWAKYGQMVLQGGQWQGQQVLSQAALNGCFQGSAALSIYGLTWWLNTPIAGTLNEHDQVPVRALNASGERLMPSAPGNVVMAAGLGNQRLYLLPDQHAVVVRFAQGGAWNDDEFMRLLLGR